MARRIHTASSFMTTVANNEEGRATISKLRKIINEANKTRDKKYVVKVRGRLGDNNPSARFYGSVNRGVPEFGRYTSRVKGGAIESGNVRIAHATRFDIYVYRSY